MHGMFSQSQWRNCQCTLAKNMIIVPYGSRMRSTAKPDSTRDPVNLRAEAKLCGTK